MGTTTSRDLSIDPRRDQVARVWPVPGSGPRSSCAQCSDKSSACVDDRSGSALATTKRAQMYLLHHPPGCRLREQVGAESVSEAMAMRLSRRRAIVGGDPLTAVVSMLHQGLGWSGRAMAAAVLRCRAVAVPRRSAAAHRVNCAMGALVPDGGSVPSYGLIL